MSDHLPEYGGETGRKFRALWDHRDELPPEHKAQLEAIVRRSAEMVVECVAIVQRYADAGVAEAERVANEGDRP
jgi:hypothetical protein